MRHGPQLGGDQLGGDQLGGPAERDWILGILTPNNKPHSRLGRNNNHSGSAPPSGPALAPAPRTTLTTHHPSHLFYLPVPHQHPSHLSYPVPLHPWAPQQLQHHPHPLILPHLLVPLPPHPRVPQQLQHHPHPLILPYLSGPAAPRVIK